MRFSRLIIDNLLGIEHVDLTLDEKVTILMGPNGAGKTTVLDAIQVAVKGTARGVPKKSAKKLTRNAWAKRAGEHGWRVEPTVRLGAKREGTFFRTASSLAALKVDTTTGEEVQIDLTETRLRKLLGVDPEVLSACLDVWRALRMTAAERRVLALRLDGVKINKETLTEKGLVDPELQTLFLAGKCKAAETRACERKRSYNRAAGEKEADPPKAPVVTIRGKEVSAADVKAETLAKMQRAKQHLETRERELIARQAREEGAQEGALEVLQEQLAEKERELAELEIPKMIEEGTRLDQEVQALEKQREEKSEALQEAEEAHAARRLTLDGARARVVALQLARKEHACDSCGFAHTAPNPPGEEEIATQEDEVGDADQAVRAATTKVESATAALTMLDEDLTKLQTNLDDVKRSLRDAMAFEKNVKALRKEVTKAQEAAAAPEPEDVSEELAEIQAKLERARDTLGKVVDYRQALGDHRKNATEAEEFRTEAESFATQEKLCRPDGIQAALVLPTIEKIRARFVKWDRLLSSVGVPITVTDELEVVAGGIPIQWQKGEWVGLPSESEIWRISLALADAMAQLSGLRFLAIDEAASLSLENRRLLPKVLRELSDDFDQVIVCLPLGEKPPAQAPAGSGVRVYHVDGGKIEPAPAKKAKAVTS